MTTLLSCDGCGSIVSDRPDDDDPTATWWCLSAAPVIGAYGLLPMISVTESSDGALDPEPLEVTPTEPARHFCSVDCVGKWVALREGAP